MTNNLGTVGDAREKTSDSPDDGTDLAEHANPPATPGGNQQKSGKRNIDPGHSATVPE